MLRPTTQACLPFILSFRFVLQNYCYRLNTRDMCNYLCMHWILMMCLHTSVCGITPNVSARTKSPCSRIVNAYGTRRFRCDRHTRNYTEKLHIHIETLIICGKILKMQNMTLYTCEDHPHTRRDPRDQADREKSENRIQEKK